MLSITTHVTERQVRGALHQSEGVNIRSIEETEYTFVPLTGFFEEGADLGCTGVVYPLKDGEPTDEEFSADLWLRSPESTDSRIELDILTN